MKIRYVGILYDDRDKGISNSQIAIREVQD